MEKINSKATFKKIVKHYLDQIEYFRNISEECPYFPKEICIEPTNACNLRCIHCHHYKREFEAQKNVRPFGMMELAIFKKVIDEIAPLNCSIAINVQGEPTLHPELVAMITYAKKKGVFTSLLTNGTVLTEELSTTLIELKLDRIVFSFDAVDKKLYESIRIRSKFEPTLKNILTFIRFNHEQGHCTHICMSTVSQQRNLKHLEEFKRYFNRLPVDRIFFNPLLNLAGASGLSHEVDLKKLQQGPQKTWPICRIPWEDITVNWDGEVCPCPVDVNVIYSIGNIKKSSLQELWNNVRMKQFRLAHLERDYTLIEQNGPLCGHCNCLWDIEYDIRSFRDFAVEAIYRHAVRFAHQFMSPPSSNNDQKYNNLLEELQQLRKIF